MDLTSGFSAATRHRRVAAIQANQSYITIESTAFPAGELRGTFQKIIGSQTFTPPPPPPAITINPPTPFDAARFLQQAAFGGQISEVTTLSNPLAANAATALNDWLTQQFNTALPIAPARVLEGVRGVERQIARERGEPVEQEKATGHEQHDGRGDRE